MTVIYVSPQGNDAWSGRAASPSGNDGPVATLDRARQISRTLKGAGPLEVRVIAGTYPLEKSIHFDAADSGTIDSPIVYKADGDVRLLGGRVVSGWTPVNDVAILERLSPEARTRVLMADLAAQGMKDYGQLRSRGFGRPSTPVAMELFFNGSPMTLARYPNQGDLKIAAIPQDAP